MRRFLALALITVLAFAACTSGDDSGTTKAGGGPKEGSTTTLDPQEVAKHPGITADAIKLGITYVDLKAVAAVTSISHGDYEASFRAVIDDLNKRGGINGRKIEPVFAPVNPIGTAPAEAACLKLTEDDQVFAIVGFFLGDAVLCPLENHDTAVLGGDMNPERLERAKAPWFSLEQSSDLQSEAVKTLHDQGALDGKLAVFVQNTDQALWEDTLKPELDDLGVKPVATAVLDTPATDVAAGIAQVGVIANKFKSAGADKVLVVGNGGTAWATGLAKTDYRPQSIFITINTISAYASNAAGADLTVLDGSLAANVATNEMTYSEPKMKKCVALVEKATGTQIKRSDEVPKGEPDNFVSASAACSYIALFEALAKAAGKDLNYATFRAAAEKAGPIAIPGDAEPLTFGPPPHADGDPAVYVFRWDPGANRFVAKN
jgi:ABC-type branched-subunit amino acid transport system substrate-binding protein